MNKSKYEKSEKSEDPVVCKEREVLYKPAPVPTGKEKNISDIQKFIDKKNWKFSPEELHQQVIRFITLESALDAWIETKKNTETRRAYRKALKQLFQETELPIKIGLNYPIDSLRSSFCFGIHDVILYRFQAPENIKTICLSAYVGFCEFIKAKSYGSILPEIAVRHQDGFHKAKEVYLNVDWNAFLSNLKGQHQLISKIIYLAAEQWKYRIRIGKTRKTMLLMTLEQVDFDRGLITFTEDQNFHFTRLTIPFPETIMAELKLCTVGKTQGILFTSPEGKNLSGTNFEKTFATLSRKLGLPFTITPTTLSWAGVFASENKAQLPHRS